MQLWEKPLLNFLCDTLAALKLPKIHQICLKLMAYQCPGFGWDSVHFLLSSWHSAVFWVRWENSVDNALMVWLLLSGTSPKSRTLQFSVLCQRGVHQKPWGSTAGTAEGILHSLEHHGQDINWGELIKAWGRLEYQSVAVGGEQLYRASLDFLGVNFSFLLSITINSSSIFYFVFISKPFLAQATGCFFSDSPPHPTGGSREREHAGRGSVQHCGT